MTKNEVKVDEAVYTMQPAGEVIDQYVAYNVLLALSSFIGNHTKICVGNYQPKEAGGCARRSVLIRVCSVLVIATNHRLVPCNF